jgi:hypothetical protein
MATTSMWERTPDRRKPTDSISPQNWTLRLQKLRTQNAILESERDHYKQLYERSVETREEVRKKAKAAVQIMKAIYNDYVELQEIMKCNEQMILNLKATIQELEHKLTLHMHSGQVKSATNPKQQHVQSRENHLKASFFAEGSRVSATEEYNGQDKQYFNTIFNSSSRDEIQFDEEIFNAHSKNNKEMHSASMPLIADHSSQESENLVEECATLRARVTELEGFLVGTLYHSAKKSTPHKIVEKDLAPFTPAKHVQPDSAISKMIEALKQAANGSHGDGSIDASANESSSITPSAALKEGRAQDFLDCFDRAMSSPKC